MAGFLTAFARSSTPATDSARTTPSRGSLRSQCLPGCDLVRTAKDPSLSWLVSSSIHHWFYLSEGGAAFSYTSV